MPNFPNHIDGLTRLLQVSTARHNAISHNLANVNTPGYRRVDVDFEDQLNRLSSDQDAIEIEEIDNDADRPIRMDGNNVDVDYELGQLNQNALFFETCSQLISSQLMMMRLAVG
ncbi:flagellar basal body rod protein FlgB [Thalassoglobus sp. JC818]|uniref:flagellar basal body rod protein FlgB n=1 Tax=Thalassoglobus sp. JC818 TaxID=3232136 RepID=UPI003458A988